MREGIVVACVCPSVRPSVRPHDTLPCPHYNLPQFWAEITKFVPNVQHGIHSVGIENRVIHLDLQGHFDHFNSEF